MTLDPLPSILCNERPTTRLLPFPDCPALMMRTPVAFVIVKVAVPVFWASMLWLNEIELGLSVATHCGIGVADGDGLGVGVGDAFGLLSPPFPLFPSLPLPLPFPFGVAVGEAVGEGVGVGDAVSDGDGLTSGLGDTEADGDADVVPWSTSSPTLATVTSGIFPSGKYCDQIVTSPEPDTSTGILSAR